MFNGFSSAWDLEVVLLEQHEQPIATLTILCSHWVGTGWLGESEGAHGLEQCRRGGQTLRSNKSGVVGPHVASRAG